MSKHDQYMTLSDGREVLVDYEVDCYGSEPSGMYGDPEHYDPGSGPELHIERIRLAADGSSDDEIVLPDEDRWKLEATIAENPDWWMPDNDGADDYRDYDD